MRADARLNRTRRRAVPQRSLLLEHEDNAAQPHGRPARVAVGDEMIVEDERKPTAALPTEWQMGDTVMSEDGDVWLCTEGEGWVCLTGVACAAGELLSSSPNEWDEDVIQVECILRVVR